MVKYGEKGLAYEIVKAVNEGEIIEPITVSKIKAYCNNNGLNPTENQMKVILSNGSDNEHSPTYKKYFYRVADGEYVILEEFKKGTKLHMENELEKAIRSSKRDSSKKRKARLQNRASVIPEIIEVTTKAFRRNADVIAEVLIRANGVCEECCNPAPFNRASDGSPYLEVHHKVRLADGGEDTVDNTIAVCPNCHRKLHFG